MAEGQGHAGSYIHSTVKAVKSWLAHNHREIKAKVKIRGTNDTPSLKDERVPTPQELKHLDVVHLDVLIGADPVPAHHVAGEYNICLHKVVPTLNRRG